MTVRHSSHNSTSRTVVLPGTLIILCCYLCSCLLICALPCPVQCLASTKSRGKTRKSSSASSPGTGFGSTQAPVFIHTPDTSTSIQKLTQFLTSQNAKGLNADKVDVGIHQQTGMRGLYCTENIKKGQLICQIPSDCALALSDPNLNGDDCPTIAHSGANLISMYLQPENARQFWSFYLDTLPQRPTLSESNNNKNDDDDGQQSIDTSRFDPTPDFMFDDDLDLLEFPRLVEKAKQRKVDIEQVATEKSLDKEELQFATWVASSRSFELNLSGPDPSVSNKDDSNTEEVKSDGSNGDDGDGDDNGYVMPKHDKRGQIISKSQQKSIRVLVPFLDLVNHSSDQANCKITLVDPEKDDAWFALEATRPITAGKELTISYGNGVESSVELLLNYGFVPSSNRFDTLMLKKGGDDCISSLDGWTTTLEEDRTMLGMTEDDPVLQKILRFRIRLKEAYE